jgi:hypothetical protein
LVGQLKRRRRLIWVNERNQIYKSAIFGVNADWYSVESVTCEKRNGVGYISRLAARSGAPHTTVIPGDVHGKIGDDGIERITTQLLLDILEVPQRNRGAGACRRLAKLMAELGWMAVRVRGLTQGGYLEQVRGYARRINSNRDEDHR